MKTQNSSIRQAQEKQLKTQKIVDFLFEAATLKRLKRTGWQIIGDNSESIAEHTYMVAVISYVFSLQLKVDIKKILLMALFHDLDETRTGDVYKLADLYISVDKIKAGSDALSNLKYNNELTSLLKEY